MELEYKDTSRRGRYIVIVGLLLAVVAGAAAFYLISQAQQSAGQGGLQKVAVVVAARPIPARKPIEAGDLAIREVPIDPTNAQGIVSDPAKLIGRVLAVTVLQDQLVTTNLLASTNEGTTFSILGPDETVAPDSPAWRAVSLTVGDDRAVAGLLQPGQTVDVIMTATVNVPQDLLDEGTYYTDKSTKITYQNMLILTKVGVSYVVKAPLDVAEEITHMQATGNVQFSMLLRPPEDTRLVDVTALGQTTNRLITKYGLPIPETYPAGSGPVATPPPLPTPFPSPGASPAPSAAP
jgi:Flp pilus assembly protein CpaB